MRTNVLGTSSAALIPPSTFMQVVDRLPKYTYPKIHSRSFRSGRKVVHTPWFTHKEFSKRLSILIGASGPKTTIQVANQENVAIGLVEEMIASAEEEGRIIRDEPTPGVIYWWTNDFSNFVWDGES